jgi:hypothetical protein
MSHDHDLTQPASTPEEPYIWARRPDVDRDINYTKGPRGYYYPCFARGTMDAQQGRPADAHDCKPCMTKRGAQGYREGYDSAKKSSQQ